MAVLLWIVGGVAGVAIVLFVGLVALVAIFGDDLESVDDPVEPTVVTGQPAPPAEQGTGQSAGGDSNQPANSGTQQAGGQAPGPTEPTKPEPKRIGPYAVLAEGALLEEPVHVINSLSYEDSYYLFSGWSTADGGGVVTAYEWLEKEQKFDPWYQWAYDSPLLDIAVGDLYNGTDVIATLLFEKKIVFIGSDMETIAELDNDGILWMMIGDFTADGLLETLMVVEDDEVPGSLVYRLARFDRNGQSQWLGENWESWGVDWVPAHGANQGLLFVMEPDWDDQFWVMAFAEGRFWREGTFRVSDFERNDLNFFNGGSYNGQPAVVFTQMLPDWRQEWRMMVYGGGSMPEVHRGITDVEYFAYHLPVQLPGLSGSQLLTLDYLGRYYLLELP